MDVNAAMVASGLGGSPASEPDEGARRNALVRGRGGVYPRAMGLLVVGLTWIVLGGLVMGGGAVLLERQASGSVLEQLLEGLRHVMPGGNDSG